MRVRFAAVLLVLYSLPALAVLPPDLYQQARAEADHHVQIAVTKVSVPWKTPGDCTVFGTVVTVFRSAGGVLAEGTPVRFDVSCSRQGDDIPVGGTLWQNAWHLERAKFFEAYLMGDDPMTLWIARWQSMTIPGPRATPYCPADGGGFTCD